MNPASYPSYPCLCREYMGPHDQLIKERCVFHYEQDSYNRYLHDVPFTASDCRHYRVTGPALFTVALNLKSSCMMHAYLSATQMCITHALENNLMYFNDIKMCSISIEQEELVHHRIRSKAACACVSNF